MSNGWNGNDSLVKIARLQCTNWWSRTAGVELLADRSTQRNQSYVFVEITGICTLAANGFLSGRA